jgi:hypothetical protein
MVLLLIILLVWNFLLTLFVLAVAAYAGQIKMMQDKHLEMTLTSANVIDHNFKAILSSIKSLTNWLSGISMGEAPPDAPEYIENLQAPPSGTLKN